MTHLCSLNENFMHPGWRMILKNLYVAVEILSCTFLVPGTSSEKTCKKCFHVVCSVTWRIVNKEKYFWTLSFSNVPRSVSCSVSRSAWEPGGGCILKRKLGMGVSGWRESLRRPDWRAIFSLIFILYCSIVDLQCRVSFRHMAKWFSYTHIHSFPKYYGIQSGVPCALQ